MVDKIFTAMKAFIIHNNKVLVLKESEKYKEGTNAGKFDIVGGRVEPGQRFDESLLREIKEETGLQARIGKPFFVNEWRPEVKGEKWQIIATFFECHVDDNHIQLSQDHDECKWINPEEYKSHNLIEQLHPAFEAFLNK